MSHCSDQREELLVAKIKGVFCNKDLIIIDEDEMQAVDSLGVLCLS